MLVLNKFSEDTDFHGWKFVLRRGRSCFTRFLWALVCLLSLVGFIFVSIVRVEYYYSYPYTSTSHTSYSEISLPAVAICAIPELNEDLLTSIVDDRYIAIAAELYVGMRGLTKYNSSVNQLVVNSDLESKAHLLNESLQERKKAFLEFKNGSQNELQDEMTSGEGSSEGSGSVNHMSHYLSSEDANRLTDAFTCREQYSDWSNICMDLQTFTEIISTTEDDANSKHQPEEGFKVLQALVDRMGNVNQSGIIQPISKEDYKKLVWNINSFKLDECWFNSGAGTRVDCMNGLRKRIMDGKACYILDHYKRKRKKTDTVFTYNIRDPTKPGVLYLKWNDKRSQSNQRLIINDALDEYLNNTATIVQVFLGEKGEIATSRFNDWEKLGAGINKVIYEERKITTSLSSPYKEPPCAEEKLSHCLMSCVTKKVGCDLHLTGEVKAPFCPIIEQVLGGRILDLLINCTEEARCRRPCRFGKNKFSMLYHQQSNYESEDNTNIKELTFTASPFLNLVQVLETPVYTWDSMASELGGIMGLLLGASVLTLCHLMETLARVCFGLVNGRVSKSEGKVMRSEVKTILPPV